MSEKLLLRLQREHQLDGAISLQEISRTRSTDIALNAYLARRQPSQEVPKPIGAGEATGEGKLSSSWLCSVRVIPENALGL